MKAIAKWDRVRSAWMTEEDHLCGHSDVYSEIFPSSGMTLRGQAFVLPTWEPPTPDTASSSSPGLPTPRARDWKRGGKDGLEEALRDWEDVPLI